MRYLFLFLTLFEMSFAATVTFKEDHPVPEDNLYRVVTYYEDDMTKFVGFFTKAIQYFKITGKAPKIHYEAVCNDFEQAKIQHDFGKQTIIHYYIQHQHMVINRQFITLNNQMIDLNYEMNSLLRIKNKTSHRSVQFDESTSSSSSTSNQEEELYD